MGLAFSVVGLSMLIGTPIFGALLAPAPAGALVWWRALVFAGVRPTFPFLFFLPRPSSPISTRADLWLAQVCIFAGLLFMSLSRALFARRRARPELEPEPAPAP